MARFRKYQSKATVQARKVTDKDGEDVVTTGGPVHVAKGDYVVKADDENGTVQVVNAEDFENQWKGSNSGSKSRKSKSKGKGKGKDAKRSEDRSSDSEGTSDHSPHPSPPQSDETPTPVTTSETTSTTGPANGDQS